MKKIAYTVFYSKKLDKDLSRSIRVKALHEYFSKDFVYLKNDAIAIRNEKEYKIALKQNPTLAKYKLKGSFRYGAIGLLFSTILAYEKMINEPYDIFLILEDDAQVNHLSIDLLLDYIKELPEDFDVLSMHDTPFFFKNYDKDQHDIGMKNLCLPYNRISTMAYAISKNGLNKYLEIMREAVEDPIDLLLFDENKNTKQFAIKPSSPQLFLSNNFNNIGEPEYQFSNINKTKEVLF